MRISDWSSDVCSSDRGPADPQYARRTISNEVTEFAFTDDHTTWWNGAYLPNRYEYLYRKSPLSAIWKAVTPLTMKTAQGLYLSVHEAALVDYAEMTLENVGHNRLKRSEEHTSELQALMSNSSAVF